MGSINEDYLPQSDLPSLPMDYRALEDPLYRFCIRTANRANR